LSNLSNLIKQHSL